MCVCVCVCVCVNVFICMCIFVSDLNEGREYLYAYKQMFNESITEERFEWK